MKETNFATDFVDLFMNGVKRAAELQKKALEAASIQTAEAVAASKKTIDAMPTVPGMLDTVQKGFDRYLEAQKGVIDLMVQQTAALVEATKQTGGSAEKILEDFTNSVQQSVERTLEVEKQALTGHTAKAATAPTKHKG